MIAISKVSRACEFNRKTRAIIYERDLYKCIIPGCTNSFGLGVAHIFYPRSKGGLGVKENGVLLCQSCHHKLDNGSDSNEANKIEQYCKEYLRARYEFNERDLIYNKWKNFKYKE